MSAARDWVATQPEVTPAKWERGTASRSVEHDVPGLRGLGYAQKTKTTIPALKVADFAVLILVRVQVETNYPRPGGDAADAVRIGGEPGQTAFQLPEDAGHLGEDAVGELLLPQLVPEMLLGVELWGVGREPVEADVLRDDQGVRDMRTGAVDDHDDEVLRMRRADVGEELAHPLGVHLGAEHPVQLSFHRAHRAIDVGELPLVAVVDDGPFGHGRPAATDPHHATEAGLVLEHQADPPALDRLRGQQGCQHIREFFFQSSWTSGRLFGWRVSGATLRQPWRASSR